MLVTLVDFLVFFRCSVIVAIKISPIVKFLEATEINHFINQSLDRLKVECGDGKNRNLWARQWSRRFSAAESSVGENKVRQCVAIGYQDARETCDVHNF